MKLYLVKEIFAMNDVIVVHSWKWNYTTLMPNTYSFLVCSYL